MAWQLIYTSAPRGLVAGRSGFCTVARHREIRDGLVTAIERFSQYDRSGRRSGKRDRIVYAHRIVRLGAATYHVLSCTRDAGADYTGRTNHLAHHLIGEAHELAGAPSPAEILAQMPWLTAWPDAPRHFGAEEAVDLAAFTPRVRLPAQEWRTHTGDAGCAALPVEGAALSGSAWLYPAEASDEFLLPLFAESLLLLDPRGTGGEALWRVPFTTVLQATDDLADFTWRGCAIGSAAALAAQGSRQTLDFTAPRALRAPDSSAAELARTGGRPAAVPAAAPPAPLIGTAAAAVPPPPADSAPMGPPPEPDLESLLESADAASGKPWARSHIGPTSRRHGPEPSQAKRGVPTVWLLGSAAALVLVAGVSFGVSLWRAGQGETLASELRGLRNGGDFVQAEARLRALPGFVRSYEPLKIEIERTEVAIALARLKDSSPAEADRFLTENRDRLAAPIIQSDFALRERFEKLDRWRKLDERLNRLQERVSEVASREAKAVESIRTTVLEEETAIGALDAAYRHSVAIKLQDVKRRLLLRRIESLEHSIEAAPPAPDRTAVAASDLLKEARGLGVTRELEERVQDLYKKAESAARKPAPAPPPPPPPPLHASTAAGASELPKAKTYVALASSSGFNISGVDEMQSWGTLPNSPILLIHWPEPSLAPPHEKAIPASVNDGRLYGGTTALLSLKKPDLVLFDERAKERLSGRFSLTFGTGGDAFSLICTNPGETSRPLMKLPRREWLGVDAKAGTLIIKKELRAALALLRPAASLERQFALRARGWGERDLSLSLGSGSGDLVVELTPLIHSLERAAQEEKAKAPHPAVKSRDEKVRAAKAARDLLMGKDDPTGLSRAGIEVGKGIKDGIKEDAPLATVDNYINPVKGVARGPIKNGLAFIKYTRDLMHHLESRLVSELGAVKAKRHRLDATKSKDKDAIAGLMAEMDRLQSEIDALGRALEKFDQKLPETFPGLSKERLDTAIGIWTDLRLPHRGERKPTQQVLARWNAVFAAENIEKIRPFLEWDLAGQNDGDLDHATAKLGGLKPIVTEPVEDKFTALLTKLRNDLPSLGPFSLELKIGPGIWQRVAEFTEAGRAENSP